MKKKHVQSIQGRVRESYSAIAGEFDATRKQPWEEFHHFLGYVRKGARTLDLGCGNGRLFETLRDKKTEYLGVDNNSSLLDRARENYPEARFQLADMMSLSLPEEAFDNVFCIAAFHHVPGREGRWQVAESMYRALKPDGILILTVWNLFQFRYVGALLRAIGECVLFLGLKYAWNDVWIKWGGHPVKRYYHAFLPKELLRCFPADCWEIEEFYFTRKGGRVNFWRSFNLVLIARKKS